LNTEGLFPLLGHHHPFTGSVQIDLSEDGICSEFLSIEERITNIHLLFPGQVLYGGYLEKRSFYTDSSLFKDEIVNRNIHLGIDIWAPEGTNVYMPEGGIIHSFQFNNHYLDYGGTIIITLDQPVNGASHLLLGHLSLESLENLYPGKRLTKGESLAAFGNRQENGGWPPHLHLQLIKNNEGFSGDYPGLCSRDELHIFAHNSPDPGAFPIL